MPRSPQTRRDALQSGGRQLSLSEVAAIPTLHRNAAVSLIGSDGGPGSYCNETPCVNGKKYVIYRDNTGGCTHYVEVDC